MRKRYLLVLVAVALSLPFVLCARTSQEQSHPKVWAAISVSEPLFQEGRTKELMIHFALVNDGSGVVNPKVGSWKVIVNGAELEDSGFFFGNGPRDARWEALPPGASLRFAYALEQYFKKPGMYTVSWKGVGFETAPIVFRVVPRKAA